MRNDARRLRLHHVPACRSFLPNLSVGPGIRRGPREYAYRWEETAPFEPAQATGLSTYRAVAQFGAYIPSALDMEASQERTIR